MKHAKFITAMILLLILCGCGSLHTHTWTEPDYQTPSTCTVCGLTRGTPKPADFDTYGIKTDLKTGEPAEYHTICRYEDAETTGTVTVTDVSCGNDSGTSGYEQQTVTMTVVFNDVNSNDFGFYYNYITTDFYDIVGFETSFKYVEGTTHSFTVNYKGKDYDQCRLSVTTSGNEWVKKNDGFEKTITITWNLTVPQGYDGIVVGVRNSGLDSEGKYYIYEYYNETDFLLFRVNGHEDN